MLHDYLCPVAQCFGFLPSSPLAQYLLCCTAPNLRITGKLPYTSLYAHVSDICYLHEPHVGHAKNYPSLKMPKLSSFFSPFPELYFLILSSNHPCKLGTVKLGTCLFTLQLLLNFNNSTSPSSKISCSQICLPKSGCSCLHLHSITFAHAFSCLFFEWVSWRPMSYIIFLVATFPPSLFCPSSWASHLIVPTFAFSSAYRTLSTFTCQAGWGDRWLGA